jgi:hypothetical protein
MVGKKGLDAMNSALLAAILVLLAGSSDSARRLVQDSSGNCQVDWGDLLILSEQWLDAGGVFQESGGLVVIEAEHYLSKTEGSGLLEGCRWQHLSSNSAVGETYIQVLPDAGKSIDFDLESSSPRLSYRVNFGGRGLQTCYLWLKGRARDRASDDVHYGLDDFVISSGWNDCLRLPTSTVFNWRSLQGDGLRPILTIPSPGEHTLHLWMREDGAQIDRLLLTVDPDYVPDSPAESNSLPELVGDLDGDYLVSMPDFALLAQHWLRTGSVDPNLLGRWQFDEGSGNIASDSSGNDHDGVIVGGAEWSAAGRVAGALNFKGLGNVEIPIEVFASIDKEITIALWQYGSESQPVQDSIFQTSRPGYATNLNIHLPDNTAEVIWDCPSDDRTKYVTGSPNEYKGRWNHWVFTKNVRTGYAKIYLNGSLVRSAVGKKEPIIPQPGITQASIGSYCSGDGKSYGFYEGLVDDFRIYDRELTEVEIAKLAAAGSAWNPSPSDNAEHVPPHARVVLSWSLGDDPDIASHNVYFGTSFNDVNSANNSLPVGGVYKGNQALDANSYDPGELEPGKTYYWRIDEVTYNKRKAPRKGKVWSFFLHPLFKNGYGLWIEDSMKRVFPRSRPDTYPEDPKVRISLARGEYESFQIVILPASQRALSNVRIVASDLVKGDATISARNIEWHQVGYVWIDNHYVPAKDSYLDEGARDGWWPDLLLPVDSFDIADDHAQPIWVTVYGPPWAPTGQYAGTLTVIADNALPTEVDINIEVYDFTLAKGPGHCKTAFQLTDRYGNWSWAPGEYPKYADFVLRHRLNPDYYYRSSFPDVSDLEHFYDLGMNSYGIIGARPNVSHDGIDSFLSALAQAPHGNELREMAMFYGFDEATSDKWGQMRDTFMALERDYPDIERMTTALIDPTPANMAYYYIDWICPSTPSYNFDKGEALRAAGYQQWSYVYWAPYNNQYANFLVQYPLIESRVLWWQMYFQKMDGFLYWSMLYWEDGTPIDPRNGPFVSFVFPDSSYGDGILLYRGIDGPIASLRLANIRDGIEDYEYLWMLAEKYGIDTAREKCAEVAWALHAPTSFTHDPSNVRATRDSIAEILSGRSFPK